MDPVEPDAVEQRQEDPVITEMLRIPPDGVAGNYEGTDAQQGVGETTEEAGVPEFTSC